MGRRIRDVSGERFGRLVAISRVGRRSQGRNRGQSRWRCLCDCGGTNIVNLSSLHAGTTRSCGCLLTERFAAMTTHGDTGSSEHNIWKAMIRRCENPNNPDWHRYGGRGIRVCRRWREDYATFLSDMGRHPPGKTLDRKDNEGNYTPRNCRWATPKQQANNRQKRKAHGHG